MLDHDDDGICNDTQYFSSSLMHAGDLSLFRGNCLHFGPANPDAETRHVLFIMLTPDGGPDDSKQEYVNCS
ncbi:MAG: hypothetical protein Q7T57_05140 [Dehalococcoidales bacterium]|nr:hypothetical protein [Dehalococcoidales bacterium]